MDYFLIAAVLLMIIGIAGSIVPGIPGVLASVTGVGLYWWSTGYAEPGNIFMMITIALGLTALLLDWFSGTIAAKAGGASNKTSLAAAVAAGIGFFLMGGPFGAVVLSGLVVFAREYMRTLDVKESQKAGVYSAIGVLASTFMQVLIAVTIMVGFLLSFLF